MQEVRPIRPDREVLTRQQLPYFVGISGQTVGASGMSMHLVTIPPGAGQSRTITSGTKPASMCWKGGF